MRRITGFLEHIVFDDDIWDVYWETDDEESSHVEFTFKDNPKIKIKYEESNYSLFRTNKIRIKTNYQKNYLLHNNFCEKYKIDLPTDYLISDATLKINQLEYLLDKIGNGRL